MGFIKAVDGAEVINMSRKEQVLEQFKKIFDAVDKDKSGGLDRKEIMNFVKDMATAMGESDQIPKDKAEIDAGLDEMFKELDTDGDGVISFDEVLACAEKNGGGEFFDGIDGASEEEWAMGFGMISGLADAVSGGDFSQLPMMAAMMGGPCGP